MTMELQDKLYTSTQVADILGVSLRTLYRYMEDGRIGSMRTASGRHRFTKQNIVDFLNAGGFGEYTNDRNQPLNQNAPSSNREPMQFGGYQDRQSQEREIDPFRNDYQPQRYSNFEFEEPKFEPRFPQPQPAQAPVQTHINRYDDFRIDQQFGQAETQPQQQPQQRPNQSSSFFDNARPVEKQVKNSYFDQPDFDEDDFDFGYNPIKTRNQQLPVQETPSTVIGAMEKNTGFYDNNVQKRPADEFEINKDKFSYQPFMSQTEKREDRFVQTKTNDQEWNFARSQNEQNFPQTAQREVRSETGSFFDTRRPSQIQSETVDLSYGVNIRYYKSEYTDLIELARKIRDVSKNRDLEYAFTIFAGLSLHFPIKPFTILHFYANPEDMQIWKDDLKLVPSNKKEDANIGIIVNTDIVFVPTKEVSGFKVVDDKVLMRDLTDVKEEDLARQFKQHLSS